MRKSLWKLAVVGAVHAAPGACAADQASYDELKAELQQAMKTIQDLQARMTALEQQKATAPAAAAVAVPAAAAWAPVVSVGTRAEDGVPDPDKARVEFYGQAMIDTIYDFKRMNPDWQATLRPSQIPIVCPGSPGCGKDGTTVFSVRQSSLGFKSFIPTSLGLVKTDLSFDLFATNGGTQVHWLNAWAELGMYGAGQTYSNFMDIDVFPNIIDYWGPSGMVFVRNPQLRLTPYSKDGLTAAFSLEAPNSAIDTGRITRVDPALGAGITGWNRAPDVVASLRMDGDWGHVRAAAIVRQVGFQNTISFNSEPSGSKTGYGLNLSGTYSVFGKDQLSAQVVGGQAIASYMNDGGVDLAPGANLQAETVGSLGWLVYYNHAWSEKWSSAIGYSEHRQNNTAGQLATAFHKGSYSSVNLLYAASRSILLGGEFIWGRLENKFGLSADDYRLQFSTKVTF
ncbi:DcaP family trimeric outer membrane transporter [Variovorax sp. J31P179]|uniref:DcaP family trimeric outer membrane transporter n=1 Tax=Variovorax sp. J31P179 TaxID=3053508 RepID=UPI002576BCA9|nr:DcaP family trimeric outer membrane transporter [Variovorax sp. J31P179]MDM0085501.1 DcaP family trimeric outer membrane transporter [Variovorax sp. J31P179]